MPKPRKLVRPSGLDPVHSVDLFDTSRLNSFDETYCVAAGILPSEAGAYWEAYVKYVVNGKE